MTTKKLILQACLAALSLILEIGVMQAEEYKEQKTISIATEIGLPAGWKATAYIGASGMYYTKLPGKVCFSDDNTSISPQCEVTDGFENLREFKIVQFQSKGEPRHGVLFSTNYWGAGGGPVRLTLWIYDNQTNTFRNILPKDLRIDALGTYKFFPSLREKSIFIVARPYINWGKGIDDPKREAPWDPHLYILEYYRYSQDKEFVYERSLKTDRKYDPEADADTLIDSEMKKCEKLFR